MSEANTEEEKAENPEPDPLGVTFRLVPQHGHDCEQDNGQRGDRDKKSIPMIEAGKRERGDPDDHDQAQLTLPEEAGGAGKFAIANDAQDRDGENGPARPEQNGQEQKRRDDRPGADASNQLIVQLITR